MSEKSIRKFRIFYSVLLSSLLIVSGILLIVACVGVYRSAEYSPFTPEAIATHFQPIAIPIFVTIAVLIGGIVLRIVFPSKDSRPRAVLDRRAMLLRMKESFTVTDVAYETASKKERTLRTALFCGGALLCAIAAIPAILHLFSQNAFLEDYNASVLAFMPTLSIFATATTAVCTLVPYLAELSYKRETAELKAAIAKGGQKREKEKTVSRDRATALVWGIRLALLAAAALLLTFGILGGGMADILSKAINICTECIGLG